VCYLFLGHRWWLRAVLRPVSYAWKVVGLLWVIGALNYIDRQAIFSVLPPLRGDLHLSDVQLGLLGTMFLWTYGLLSPFSGFLADRFGRRRTILFSFLVWTAVTCSMGWVRSGGQLLFLRALMGVSESCYVPAALGLIAEVHGPGTRSLATGIHQNGLYFGIVIGGVGGAWLAQHYGWRTAFVVLGLTGAAFWPVLRSGLRKGKQVPEGLEASQLNLAASIRELLALHRFRLLFVAFGLYSIVPWTVYTWFPLYLYERFSFSLPEAAFYATAYIQSASIAGTIVGGVAADQWLRRNRHGILFTQITGVLLAAPFLVVGSVSSIRGLMIGGLLGFGLGRAMYECNVMPALCQVVPPELRSTAMGLLNLVGCLSGGAMTLAAGALKEGLGLMRVFEVTALLLVFVAIMLWWARIAALGRTVGEAGVVLAPGI
jgi:MFS transporter, Spinster family, sphingosine-1-phosphate transporter